uniref:TPR_REGION domain-containing protein n=1 Tax=Haemonchus contortus TaxID=6289 RepID=A0A7I5EF57_HAECO
MSKSVNSERKRRRFEVEWEGEDDDLRTRVLMSDNYTTARYRMLMISAIRKDISEEFKQLLELQMKVKFGEYDDAISYLNEVIRDNRDFIFKVIEMVADEYEQRGVENMERYGCFFQNYDTDQGVALFRKAADASPSKASAVLLAFLAMRPQAFNAVSGILMDTLHKSPEPPHGLFAFGNSLLTMNFGNLMPDDILFVCDAILRSAFRDSLTNVVGDTKDTRKKCDRNANKFIGLTYPFFAAVTAKLGLPIFGAKVERSGVLLEKIVTSLLDKWSPPVTRVVTYALCIARLKMPSLTWNSFLLLWLPSFKATRQKQFKTDFEHSKNFMGHGVFNSLATLCHMLSPLAPDFRHASNLAGLDDTLYLVANCYLYTRQYDKCIEFCTSELAQGKERKPQLLAAIVAAHFQLGNAPAVVKSAVDFLPEIVKNDWWTLDPAISDGGATKEANFWFIPCSSAGHWLSSILLKALQSLITETSDDLLISALLVLSQVDFASYGFTTFNEAITIAENKDSFKSIGLLDFISNTAVLDRLTFMATEKPECFLSEPGENPDKQLQDIIEAHTSAIDENDRLKSTMLYLSKVGSDLVRVVEALKS